MTTIVQVCLGLRGIFKCSSEPKFGSGSGNTPKFVGLKEAAFQGFSWLCAQCFQAVTLP